MTERNFSQHPESLDQHTNMLKVKADLLALDGWVWVGLSHLVIVKSLDLLRMHLIAFALDSTFDLLCLRVQHLPHHLAPQANVHLPRFIAVLLLKSLHHGLLEI
jgi:hypothetical protein